MKATAAITILMRHPLDSLERFSAFLRSNSSTDEQGLTSLSTEGALL